MLHYRDSCCGASFLCSRPPFTLLRDATSGRIPVLSALIPVLSASFLCSPRLRGRNFGKNSDREADPI